MFSDSVNIDYKGVSKFDYWMPLIYFNIHAEILAILQMQKIFICIFAL